MSVRTAHAFLEFNGAAATKNHPQWTKLRVAVAAGEGVIADLPRVLEERARLEEVLLRVLEDQRDAARAAASPRTTLLDPRRPARDLLEHLLDGIASCHLIYAEHVNGGSFADDPGLRHEDTDGSENETSDVDEREPEEDGARERVAAEFAEFVRRQAEATRTRLS